ncbi:hypothetical protein CBR_g49532 [Chara braunii]|uniref:Uncharacterized protein n=1 Tax=Chara braunii TaxID=69332 RepID=A0A388M5B8_CHABU|nr:hypothetical protein CBR_g49532 [Chara braunii]|eukprot:GBG89679.1 hypothetical protein CBR_g49532 [Chara braunii]
MAQQKFDQAIELTESGAKLQLRHGQVLCGAELALLLVETFLKAEVKFSPEALARIRDVFECFPREQEETAAEWVILDRDSPETQGEPSNERTEAEKAEAERAAIAKSRVEGCSAFLKQALKWSKLSGGPNMGAPEIHDMLAEYVWTQSPSPSLSTVSRHFIWGSRPEAFASALIDVMKASHLHEADLVVTRGVLQYLAVGKLWDATQLLDEVRHRCCNNIQDDDAPWLPDSPLMHFNRFLLCALERKSLPLFSMLRKKYQKSLSRDPSFEKYVDEVGTRFFNLRRPPMIPGMFGDLLKAISGED